MDASADSSSSSLFRAVRAGIVVVLCLAPGPAGASPPAPAPPTQVQTLLRAGKFSEAQRQARALIEEAERIHGTESLEVAELLDQLSEAMRRGGKGGDPETREVCERAIAIKEKLLGPDDPRYAASVFQLGFLFYVNRDYERAKPLLEQALSIREAALPPNDPAVATNLYVLGGLISDMGDQAQATVMLGRAYAIRQERFGAKSPEAAELLKALADIRYRAGDFAGSVAMYETALLIFEHALGRNHEKVATCLNNLGAVLYETGDFDGAIVDTERALRIRLDVYGPDHELVITCLGNLGNLEAAKGNIAKARTRYQEALAKSEARFGAGSAHTGWIRTRIGLLDLQQGRFREAKPYLERAARDIEHDLGPDHPDLADAVAALATVDAALGDTAAAWALYQRAVAIRTKSLGPTHPDVGLVLTQYARTLEACGRYDAALDLGLQGEEVSREHLRLTSRSFAERQALDYAASRPEGIRVAVAALLEIPDAPPATVERVWDALLRSRTLVLDEIASRNRAVAEEGDSAAVRLSQELEAGRRRLANLLVSGPGSDPSARYRATLAHAREETEGIERALAARSATFRREQERSRVGYREVARALPSGTALVAFATAGDSANLAYLAFVLSGRRAEPSVVRIGPAARIDAAILRWLADINQNGAAGGGRPAGERASRASGEAVRRTVWDPIVESVGAAHRIFIVPEGTINLMSFAALPTGRNTYLIESHSEFHYLSAERDLVPGSIPEEHGTGLLAVGAPAFGKTSGSTPAGDCIDFASLRFQALPRTGEEAQEVAAIWGDPDETLLLTGAKATEAAFKTNAARRRVLHLATHGFFIAEGCHMASATTRGITAYVPSAQAQPRPRPRENPLLLSGLALAGANRRASAKLDEEDGILTAEEIAALGLSGVEWAVLSACDTGKGRIRAGEGVLGLRRAFQVAGAATVIMSLWEVEDESAETWMKALYEGRVQEGLDTADAVARASLRVLRERRAQARSTDPFYWAAFVAAGDWR